MPSLFDYSTPATVKDFLQKFGDLMQVASIPVFSWSPFAWLRRLIEDESVLLEDLGQLITTIANSNMRRRTSGVWLDRIGEGFYSEPRKPAVFTRGVLRISDVAHQGPLTVTDLRSVWAGDLAGSYRFTNLAGFVVPLDGYADVTFEAESAGEAFNLANGDVQKLFTDLPGFSVQAVLQDNGTWITQQGTNAESDAAYNDRLDLKWSTIGSGADEPAYRYRALSSAPEVTRAKVYSDAPGVVRIAVAGPSGPVSTAALALAQAANADKVLGVPSTTDNATPLITVVQATLEVLPGTDPVATKAAAQAAVQAYARGLPIGPRKVSRERIIRALEVDGVDDLNMTLPAADFVPLFTELWVPTFDVTVVVVGG